VIRAQDVKTRRRAAWRLRLLLLWHGLRQHGSDAACGAYSTSTRQPTPTAPAASSAAAKQPHAACPRRSQQLSERGLHLQAAALRHLSRRTLQLRRGGAKPQQQRASQRLCNALIVVVGHHRRSVLLVVFLLLVVVVLLALVAIVIVRIAIISTATKPRQRAVDPAVAGPQAAVSARTDATHARCAANAAAEVTAAAAVTDATPRQHRPTRLASHRAASSKAWLLLVVIDVLVAVAAELARLRQRQARAP
jgi:hypothetical protein